MKEKLERCYPLGKKNTFQCVPNSANYIYWNAEKKKWFYKIMETEEWKEAPIIGKESNKYIYTSEITIFSYITASKRYMKLGILCLLIGSLLFYYNYSFITTINETVFTHSEWLISILFSLIFLYIVFFIMLKIIKKD